MDKLNTERLIIRRFEENDWQDLYEYLSDDEVVKFEPYEAFNLEQAKEETNYRITDNAFYAVCLKDNGKLIGNIYFCKGNFDIFELGYVFNKNYQKLGYATESIKALLDYAFTKLGVRRVVAKCNPLNTSSWKLLEHLNLRREGHFLKAVNFKKDKDKNNQPIWHDTYQYAILAEEWLKLV
ncbi:MAG TPA: GNAT family N-acetyltransferase [Clostridiales bacterium]|nr:GNAT family N-acetyltransferase [Clostridiales bacterium]